MIYAQAGHTFDATIEGLPTGLTGTLGVRVVDPTTSTTPVARSTSGIVEYPPGSGVYGVTLTAPEIGSNPSPWMISVLWDTVVGGTPLTPATTFTEDLQIFAGVPPGAPSDVWRPTVAELGARMYARTLDDNGNRLGTFTDATNPTGEQADELIVDALGLVTATVGDEIPAELVPVAKLAVIARAAASIERGLYPEDTNTADSAYQAWVAEYNAAIAALTTGLEVTDALALRLV